MALTYTEAFAKYGAKLTNPQWSVSAFGNDGALAVSLWQDLLKPGALKGTLEYRDTLSQWKGNSWGCAELRKHLRAVHASGASVRLVIAHPATLADAEQVGKVPDESYINKTFSVREELVGHLESFDGDSLCIVFRRKSKK